MVRALVALVAGASLFAAALAAPMTHVHEAGDDHHPGARHGGRLVHSHGGGHHAHAARPVSGPAVEAHANRDDGEVRSLNVFQLAAGSAFALGAVAPGIFTLLPPLVNPGATARIVPQSHDPPFEPSLPSRAPPSYLS